jgi:hypothetical protein
MASALGKHKNLFVKQTRKGCFQEMLGCEAKTEFKIATMEDKQTDIFYAIEESSCCIRFCCPAIRSFTMDVSEGAGPGGKVLLHYERPLKCLNGNCKCCCYQELMANDATSQQPLGTFKEECYYCIPQFKSLNADGSQDYKVYFSLIIYSPLSFSHN